MTRDSKTPTTRPAAPPSGTSSNAELTAFLDAARAIQATRPAGSRGRLAFALDATMSRQPTWDAACAVQADMFKAAGEVGGLDIQLVYFRGLAECRASKWVADPAELADLMTRIDCRGGHTQIRKVLAHARRETEKGRIQALVYVGDCMEEDVDGLCAAAGELGLLGVPVFMFQEGHDARAEAAFREIARLTRGAFCRFSSGSAAELRALLSAVAVYAAGGRKALDDHSRRTGGAARRLIEQMG